jgi:hypothetical protein
MKGQLINFDTLRTRLEAARADALRVYQADKCTPSGAFDSGRVDGLKQALEILEELAMGESTRDSPLRTLGRRISPTITDHHSLSK